MRNITTLFLILFTLILNEKNYAQSIDFDDFYIESEEELNGVRKTQIREALREFKIALLEDLEERGERIPNRTFYENFVPAKLQGFDVKYNPMMDRFMFGKARYEKSNDQLFITTYLYNIVKEEGRTRLSAVTYDINDGFVDVCTTEQSYLLLAAATNNKLFPDLPQRHVPPTFPTTNNRPTETIVKPTPKTKPLPKPKRPASTKEKKEKTPKKKKTPPSRAKNCSKVPAVATIGVGALMGGTGIYLRTKATKMYDEDYRPLVGTLDGEEELTKARRPNQVAHIVGAAGILTAGIGVWIWAKCNKRNKRGTLSRLQQNPHFERVQITPELRYNTNSNTNTFHTTLTYSF